MLRRTLATRTRTAKEIQQDTSSKDQRIPPINRVVLGETKVGDTLKTALVDKRTKLKIALMDNNTDIDINDGLRVWKVQQIIHEYELNVDRT